MILSKIKNNKGFTLVEIVVVLVILAILAAISIPSLTGYISDSVERSRITETESIVASAKTSVSRAYKVGTSVKDINDPTKDVGRNLRTKILSNTGASGQIVGFYVSTGANEGKDRTNPGPLGLDYAPAGTLEFLEYKGSDGDWYGVYRILEDGTTEVKVVETSMSTYRVIVND